MDLVSSGLGGEPGYLINRRWIWLVQGWEVSLVNFLMEDESD